MKVTILSSDLADLEMESPEGNGSLESGLSSQRVVPDDEKTLRPRHKVEGNTNEYGEAKYD